MWKSLATPKALLFSWKCLHDMVPTRVKIGKFITLPSMTCPMCDSGEETLHHILLTCPYSQKIWFSVSLACRIVFFQNLTVDQWINYWFLPPDNSFIDSNTWTTYCIAATWSIWKARCRKVFTNCFTEPLDVAADIDLTVAKDLKGNSLLQHSFTSNSHDISFWIPPGILNLKLNVDIAFLSAEIDIGIGFILRNNMVMFLSAGFSRGHAATSEEVECQGLLFATRWCIQFKVA
ncbi:hypothetical protein FRX31_031908 [Thalictrum thalictroides]|uniref:Reverse transcriptase zinc-binding domain-containing protein n=1 Tax=Thalictrum thalictroides TaxID=46969 RepID=A0A7J6V307_THATH|nr:hypothetical protein FRX31_031908 [Thalictrum thalictroides]